MTELINLLRAIEARQGRAEENLPLEDHPNFKGFSLDLDYINESNFESVEESLQAWLKDLKQFT